MRAKSQTVKLAFKHAFAAILLVLCLAAPVAAGPFEDADAAYGSKGNYAVAVGLWFPQGVGEAQRLFLAEAQHRLGALYYFGRGVSKNYADALRWWSLAASQGIDRAQFALGALYENGQGVQQNYAQAAKWYRLAADQGLDRAQFAIGALYYVGHGVPQNYAEAAKWYRLAADQGLDHAQFNLGDLYYLGQGVTQNYTEALRWWSLAADQGLDLAQFNLGLLHYLGQGVPKDAVPAQMWFYLAAAGGNEGARKIRDNLEKQMTSAQIAEAQKLAHEWKPTKQVPTAPKM